MKDYVNKLRYELIRKKESYEYIEFCCSYAERLILEGKPVLFDSEHVKEVLKLKEIKKNGYHLFNAGNIFKPRIIEAPSLAIKERQRWIVNRILQKEELGEWIHGYVKNRSIVTNAKVHIRKKNILCLDIKNYFQSINVNMVKNLFVKEGYSESAAEELAQICTYSYEQLFCEDERVVDISSIYRYLPHGAPSSPIISNLIFQEADLLILEKLKGKEINYTRYADDMIFSSDRDELIWLKDTIEGIVSKKGFQINNDKIRLMGPDDQKILMGLNLTNGLKIQNAYKRKLRQEIYYCKKYGIQNHLKKIGKNNKSNFIGYIYGKAYFVNMIEPNLGKKLIEELDEVFSREQ